MEILEYDSLLETAVNYLINVAKQATCKRSKCGAIIVHNSELVIGKGFNSMPLNVVCDCFKEKLAPTFKSDRTCCVHAEQRAIMDALKNHSDKIVGSILYFIRLDDNDQPKHSGKPYCSICSKLALDVGISKFVL